MQTEIVIDPGHGGAQPRGNSTPEGARFGGGQIEKRVNYLLAQRVAHHLGGARLTRAEDENRSLAERVAVARSVGAQAFLSLHAKSGASGTTGVWVHPRGNARSVKLAEAIRAQLGPTYGGGPISRGELAVLSPDHHLPGTAACLVELGYGGGTLDPAASAIARATKRFLSSGGEVAQHGRRYPVVAQEDSASADPDRVRRAPEKTWFEIDQDDSAPVPPREVVAAAASFDAGLEVDVVNVAKTVWDVMKDNRPVANAASDFANAIPQGATLTDVAGWEPAPRTMRLHYHSGNIFDLNTTDVYLTISWYFNGAWNNVGQYIDAATVIATGDVAWGNTVDVTASINSPMNTGSQAAPVGALPIRIRLIESNFLQNRTKAWDGIVQGNGAGHIDIVP